MCLDFLTVEQLTLRIEKPKDQSDKFLEHFTDEMILKLPENDGFVDFANLKWSYKIQGKMVMKLLYKSSHEIELRSSGIKEVYGFGYIWKRGEKNNEKIASLTISDIKDGSKSRKPNWEPESFYVLDEEEESFTQKYPKNVRYNYNTNIFLHNVLDKTEEKKRSQDSQNPQSQVKFEDFCADIGITGERVERLKGEGFTDAEQLKDLNEEDLKELGFKMAERKKFLKYFLQK